MTLIGRGYPSRVEDVEKQHDDMPTQNVITSVTGPGHCHICYMFVLAVIKFFNS